ncbi:hypothetical protein NHX12_003636 [Muraenolepis orangiensis]|uniref:Uncharacterized protein n=1 Tax=Muraenolepis orangiensis TaxID=630683 RepID=A0A9Q0DTQ4_9TELE|nr:hypothetical protein NHX12_003636 [Muraenolepis orangiensis]
MGLRVALLALGPVSAAAPLDFDTTTTGERATIPVAMRCTFSYQLPSCPGYPRGYGTTTESLVSCRGRRSVSGTSVVAIDNKIEQAMDLVKSHLMYAVREEVEVLKEQIKELLERNSVLERENAVLKSLANTEQLSQLASPPASSAGGTPPQQHQPGLSQRQLQGQLQGQLQSHPYPQLQQPLHPTPQTQPTLDPSQPPQPNVTSA